jgi:ribA/ribD-fused uncharacterized protein
MSKDFNESKVILIYRVTENGIYGFFNEHRFLSNYHICSIVYEGIEYSSTEAAYQAAKIYYPDSLLRTNIERGRIAVMSPNEAKQETHKKTFQDQIRPNWDELRVDIMYELNKYKYLNHPELKQLLLETGDKYLEETNYWNDVFWGICKGNGLNMLGKTLMKIREEIKNNLI